MKGVALHPFPMQILRDGGKEPRTDWSGLAVITMAPPGGWNMPRVVAPLDALAGGAVAQGFLVDFPLEDETKVMQVCTPLTHTGWTISEPRRSPGHCQDFPRLRVTLSPDRA